jgi:hypothetical protein
MVLAGLLLPASVALAGGPLNVTSTGAPFVWSTTVPIAYRTDNGPLSATVTEAQARARVLAMFNVWQNVTTSNIAYARATNDGGNGVGFVNPTGAFTGGDVDTVTEYDAVTTDCNNGVQSPIIYDPAAVIFIDLGLDETSIIGFAGPCALSATQIVSGDALMNGLFQDGDNVIVPDLTAALYDAAFVHEFGHFSGLDHSQINVNCVADCAGDELEGLPTMFPFLVDVSMGTLSDDDKAWISRLYPQTTGGTTFVGTHGTITGTVFFSDDLSHAQGVNVIARRVDTGTNQDRTNAVSVVSGFKFTSNPGQSVTANYLPCTLASDCPPNGFFDNNSGGSSFGSRQSGDIGFFDISVPSGFAYTVELETIDPSFEGGSIVGPLSPPIPMPGTAPAPVTTAVVSANATISVGDLVLIGTDPRFDQFEGP